MALKVQFSYKAAGRTDLSDTESDRLTVCCLAIGELQFIDIFVANKFPALISVTCYSMFV